MHELYFDHAATTPARLEVVAAMQPYFVETIGNPSSLHAAGQRAKRALEGARRLVADLLGAEPREIVFTSGGTESNNLALRGAMAAGRARGRHLIVSAVEHHAVLHTAEALEREGCEVTYLPVGHNGRVDLLALQKSLRPNTVLVSVMLANNETGVIQPLAEVIEIAHAAGALVHTDAVQAIGKMPVNLRELGVDLLSFTAHKFYGPRGAGALYVRAGTPLAPLFAGGSQEASRRPGTENLPAIVGLATALRLALEELEEESARLAGLRAMLEEAVRQRITDLTINGSDAPRLPGISNLSIAGVDGEELLMALDLQGIAVSTGSACTAGAVEPSHVLRAMHVDPRFIGGTLRISLGRTNDETSVRTLIEALVHTAGRLRAAKGQSHT